MEGINVLREKYDSAFVTMITLMWVVLKEDGIAYFEKHQIAYFKKHHGAVLM